MVSVCGHIHKMLRTIKRNNTDHAGNEFRSSHGLNAKMILFSSLQHPPIHLIPSLSAIINRQNGQYVYMFLQDIETGIRQKYAK